MKNTLSFLILFACFNFLASAKTNQTDDLASQNFDAIVLGTTANVAANGAITFTSAKWTNDESTGTGTNAVWNKFYSNQVSIAKDATGANTSNYITSTNDRLSLLFTPQTAGTVVLEARVKTPATTGSSGFISLDNDPGATSGSATGRSNLIYFNTTAAGTTTISYTNTTQVMATGLTPATWYYIKVVYYITGTKAGKWDLYYGATEPTTLITANPIAYQTSVSAYALQRLYVSGPFLIDDIRIYQPPLAAPAPTSTVSMAVDGNKAIIGKEITGSYTYSSSTSLPEKGSKWALVRADDAGFNSQKDTLDSGFTNGAATFQLSPYTISASDAYKYIRLEITPIDNKGSIGNNGVSTAIGPVLDSYGSYKSMVLVDNENGAPQYTTGGTVGGWGTLASGQLVGFTQTRSFKNSVAGDILGNFATYKPDFASLGAGYYQVKVVSVASGSPFTVDIHHANPMAAGQYIDEAQLTVTPLATKSQWIDLGFFYFSGDGTETVKLSATNKSTVLRTDAVSFTKFIASDTDNRLLTLTTNVGTLIQTANTDNGFNSDIIDYTLVLPVSTTSYTVAALSNSSNSTITVNSTPLNNFSASAAINFDATATIVVTNNGISKTYTIKTVPPAQSIANKLILFEPIRDAAGSFSVIPVIDTNYSVNITSMSPAGIINADGTVLSRPATTTFVEVSVQIQSKTNAADVATKTLQVKVTPTYTAPTGDLADAQAAFSRKKMGFFVHYVPYLTSGKNGIVKDINVLADNFDVEQFAQDAADFGLEYVVFTGWHARMLPLFPSKVVKKWRDDRRTIPQAPSYSNRDVIGDLIKALKAKNIDLHLYMHPTDGHDFKDYGPSENILQDQALTGYTDSSNGYAYWNQYLNELLNEMCERYGDGIKGFWIDGGATRLDVPRLRKTLRSYNPNMMIVENIGGNRGLSLKTPGYTGMADHNAWEVSHINSGSLSLLTPNPALVLTDGKTWPAYVPQVALVVGNGWWAKEGTNNSQYAAKDLYLYNVLIASQNKSGGLLYSTGCSTGKASDFANANIWDGGAGNGNIYATLKAVNDYIKPVEESIKNTNLSTAYPTNTTGYAWLDQYQWGVSTESADSKYVYLHVVKPPVGKTLSIGLPTDNSAFSTTAVVLKSKQTVSFAKTATGYNITLPETENWDAVNTVIRLERATTSSKYVNENLSYVRVVDGKLLVTSNVSQKLDVFAVDGTKIMSIPLIAGENTVSLNYKGMFIVSLSANKGKVLKLIL
jgi:hypothetical protein